MARKAKEKIVCQHFSWSLFRRGNVWYADGRHGRPNLGKHSLGAKDHEAALENLRRLDTVKAIEFGFIKEAALGPDSLSDEISLEQGWGLYMAHCTRPDVLGGVAASTAKRYRAVKDKHIRFAAETGLMSWNVVDEPSVTAFGSWLHKAQYSDASIYLECTLVKQVVKWMIEKAKLLPESHRIRLSLRRSHESSTYCYSREQVRAMIESCRTTNGMEWMADVIIALATTGMRISELAALRWTDLDLNSGVITLSDNRHSGKAKKAGGVRTTKGRRTRQLPIHRLLMKIVAGLAHRPDGRVFGGPRGGVLKPDTVRNVLIREVLASLKEKFPTPEDQVGFADGRVHSFRHYFVSEAFLGGASEGEIREWVGHRDSKVVERYRHLRQEDARRKMDQLDFLGDGSAVNVDAGAVQSVPK